MPRATISHEMKFFNLDPAAFRDILELNLISIVLSPASLFFTRIVIVGDVGFLALSDV
jgi:hypothetical protein